MYMSWCEIFSPVNQQAVPGCKIFICTWQEVTAHCGEQLLVVCHIGRIVGAALEAAPAILRLESVGK